MDLNSLRPLNMHSSSALYWASTLLSFTSLLSMLQNISELTKNTSRGESNCHYSAHSVGYSTHGFWPLWGIHKLMVLSAKIPAVVETVTRRSSLSLLLSFVLKDQSYYLVTRKRGG